MVAFDGMFGLKKKGRKNVDWNQEELSKVEKKVLNRFNSAYELLHLSMGYDGASNANEAIAGI